jgi:carbonic anhydrase
MDHQNNIAALVTCMDPRLHRVHNGTSLVSELAEGMELDFDLITRAGGILSLTQPAQLGFNFDKSILVDIKKSIELHGSKIIVLLAHEDCGGYRFMKKSGLEEIALHTKELQKGREILRSAFSEVEIRLVIAVLKKNSKDEFVLREVE